MTMQTLKSVKQASPAAGSDQTLVFEHFVPRGYKPIGTTIHVYAKGYKAGSTGQRALKWVRNISQKVDERRTTMFIKATEAVGMVALMTQSWRNANEYGLSPIKPVINPESLSLIHI